MTREPSKTEDGDIMTIEVERQDKNDHFNILFHQQCGGGLIKIERYENIDKYKFKCQRCNVVHSINADDANGYLFTAMVACQF